MTGYRSVSWLDPRIEVRSSTVEGKGLFAKERINAGEVVSTMGGEILPATALDAVKARPKYSSSFITDDLIIVLRDDDPVTFGNHSCDPNLWMRDAVSEEARRDIAPGEELTAARRLGARVGCPRSSRSAQTARSRRRRCPWSCRRPRRSRARWSNRSTTTPPPARARPPSPPCPTPRRAARRGGRRALPRESPRQWRTRPIRSARLSSTSVAVVTALIRPTRGGAGESDLDVRPSSDRIAARHHNHARH